MALLMSMDHGKRYTNGSDFMKHPTEAAIRLADARCSLNFHGRIEKPLTRYPTR